VLFVFLVEVRTKQQHATLIGELRQCAARAFARCAFAALPAAYRVLAYAGPLGDLGEGQAGAFKSGDGFHSGWERITPLRLAQLSVTDHNEPARYAQFSRSESRDH